MFTSAVRMAVWFTVLGVAAKEQVADPGAGQAVEQVKVESGAPVCESGGPCRRCGVDTCVPMAGQKTLAVSLTNCSQFPGTAFIKLVGLYSAVEY